MREQAGPPLQLRSLDSIALAALKHVREHSEKFA